MFGTIVNVCTILVGGGIGIALGKSFKEEWKETMIQGIALIVIFIIGLPSVLQAEFGTASLTVTILSIVLGGLFGEMVRIESALEKMSRYVESKMTFAKGDFSKGLVSSSIIYCVGPMAILGAFEGGLTGSHQTLLAKAMLDGLTAIVLTSRYGVGVLFSSVIVLMYQGALVLSAVFLQDLFSRHIELMSAVGGLLIIALGINMLGILKIRVANLLPALFFTIPLTIAIEAIRGLI